MGCAPYDDTLYHERENIIVCKVVFKYTVLAVEHAHKTHNVELKLLFKLLSQ